MTPETVAAPTVSAWAPLRRPMYRAMWMANSTSQVGTWVQTVGAQWLMGSLAGTPLQVALVQTAFTLPYFLIAVPAGALGDIVDRRKLLMWAQALMCAGAVLLMILTFADRVTPWSLLALVFWVGSGQGVMGPSWQAIQPELVPRSEIREAAVLSGMSVNVARAVGPAIGGAVVAVAGAAWAFAINAASFLGLLGVLAAWRRPPIARTLGTEPYLAALRAGARYARSARRLRAVVARATIFCFTGGGIWALLPVLARDHLHVGSATYGLLLGGIGIGAVAAAAILPRFRGTVSPGRLVSAATIALALASAAAAWTPIIALVGLGLVVAGAAWIVVISSLTGSAQTILPDWVRSRGMSIYLASVLGGQAAGAALWGAVAERWGVQTGLTAMAAALVAGGLLARRWPVESAVHLDLSPYPWPEPGVAPVHPARGPVRVMTSYRIEEGAAEGFVAAMRQVGALRRRTGAVTWWLHRDAADPAAFVEVYDVRSWEEHLRQRTERQTVSGQAIFRRAHDLQEAGSSPRIRYLFPAE